MTSSSGLVYNVPSGVLRALRLTDSFTDCLAWLDSGLRDRATFAGFRCQNEVVGLFDDGPDSRWTSEAALRLITAVRGL